MILRVFEAAGDLQDSARLLCASWDTWLFLVCKYSKRNEIFIIDDRRLGYFEVLLYEYENIHNLTKDSAVKNDSVRLQSLQELDLLRHV